MVKSSPSTVPRWHARIAVFLAFIAMACAFRVVRSASEAPPELLHLRLSFVGLRSITWPFQPNDPRLHKYRFAREMYVSNAYVPGSHLKLLPAMQWLETVRMENRYEACSETCIRYESGKEPPGDDYRWTGSDMQFLHRYPHLRELDLRAVWLGTGAMGTIAELHKLEILGLNRCDLPSDELPQLTRLRRLRVLKFYWSYLNRPEKMTDSSWIFDLESLREVHLIGAGDDAVRLMASSIPAGCRVVVTEDQANRLIELPNVIGRPDDDLDTPKGY